MSALLQKDGLGRKIEMTNGVIQSTYTALAKMHSSHAIERSERVERVESVVVQKSNI